MDSPMPVGLNAEHVIRIVIIDDEVTPQVIEPKIRLPKPFRFDLDFATVETTEDFLATAARLETLRGDVVLMLDLDLGLRFSLSPSREIVGNGAAALQEYIGKYDIPIYDSDTIQGLLLGAIACSNKNIDRLMICLSTKYAFVGEAGEAFQVAASEGCGDLYIPSELATVWRKMPLEKREEYFRKVAEKWRQRWPATKFHDDSFVDSALRLFSLPWMPGAGSLGFPIRPEPGESEPFHWSHGRLSSRKGAYFKAVMRWLNAEAGSLDIDTNSVKCLMMLEERTEDSPLVDWNFHDVRTCPEDGKASNGWEDWCGCWSADLDIETTRLHRKELPVFVLEAVLSRLGISASIQSSGENGEYWAMPVVPCFPFLISLRAFLWWLEDGDTEDRAPAQSIEFLRSRSPTESYIVRILLADRRLDDQKPRYPPYGVARAFWSKGREDGGGPSSTLRSKLYDLQWCRTSGIQPLSQSDDSDPSDRVPRGWRRIFEDVKPTSFKDKSPFCYLAPPVGVYLKSREIILFWHE